MQFLLVALLDADFAHVLRALVVGFEATQLDLLHVFFADAADEADNVGGKFAKRILAEQTRLDINSHKAPAVCRETRHFLVGSFCSLGTFVDLV